MAEYILDREGEGEKVASHRITNCISDEPGWAVEECLALAAANTRSKKDKSYHLVVSFPPGQRPTDEQMEDIERTLVDAIGLGEHKRISAVHQNKKHWHMHIAIVTVHPVSHRNVTPFYDHYKLQEACIELEIKHYLTRTAHQMSPDHARDKAAEMEAHSGRKSFQAWVAENVAPELVKAAEKAKTWQDLHIAAAAFGVEIRPRGAGLIVSSIDDRRANIKASAVGPALAFKALTDRLGPYEEPGRDAKAVSPTIRYDGRPAGASQYLWARYQQERTQATEARAAALAALRASHLRYGQEMEAWHRKRYLNAAAQVLSLANKRSTYRTLDADKAADRARRRAVERADRQKVRDQHKAPTWPAFLAREVGRGNQPAVKVLDRFVTREMGKEGVGRG